MTWPLVVGLRLLSPLLGADAAFRALGESLALLPGPLGVVVRRSVFSRVLPSVGTGLTISFGAVLTYRTAAFGDNVYVGRYALIGNADIGHDTMLADYARVLSGQHGMAPGRRMREQDSVYTQTRIGADCWIGNGAIVMADVGDGSIVAAGAVVSRPVPPGVVVAGVPARVLRDR